MIGLWYKPSQPGNRVSNVSSTRKSECSGHSGDSTAKLNPPCLEFDSFDALKLFMPAPLQ